MYNFCPCMSCVVHLHVWRECHVMANPASFLWASQRLLVCTSSAASWQTSQMLCRSPGIWPASPSWGTRSSILQESLPLSRPGIMPHLLASADFNGNTSSRSALPPCNESYATQPQATSALTCQNTNLPVMASHLYHIVSCADCGKTSVY